MIGGSRRRHACRRAKTLWRLAYSLTLQTRSIQGLCVSDLPVCGQTLSLGLKVDGAKARTHTHADDRDFGFSGRALAAGQIRFYFTNLNGRGGGGSGLVECYGHALRGPSLLFMVHGLNYSIRAGSQSRCCTLVSSCSIGPRGRLISGLRRQRVRGPHGNEDSRPRSVGACSTPSSSIRAVVVVYVFYFQIREEISPGLLKVAHPKHQGVHAGAEVRTGAIGRRDVECG